MTILDGILLAILSGFVFYGLFFGLIRTIGSLVGVIVGTWAAASLFLPAFYWTQNLFFGYNTIGKVVCFLIIFSLTNRLACFLFALLDKIFNIVAIIPFVKTINRLAGAALGLIEGGLAIGLALYIISSNWVLGGWFAEILAQSDIAAYLLDFIGILKPYFPEIMKRLQELI